MFISTIDNIVNISRDEKKYYKELQSLTEYIKNNKISVNYILKNKKQTLLSYAITKNNDIFAKWLIIYGANVNLTVDQYNRNSLFEALNYGNKNLLTLLIDKGADVNNISLGKVSIILILTYIILVCYNNENLMRIISNEINPLKTYEKLIIEKNFYINIFEKILIKGAIDTLNISCATERELYLCNDEYIINLVNFIGAGHSAASMIDYYKFKSTEILDIKTAEILSNIVQNVKLQKNNNKILDL